MAIEDEQRLNTMKKAHSSSSSTEPLPLEIIFDILSRLPVESLLRCKSVCKSWRSLISDPHFINHHLTLSTTNHAHHHLLVSSVGPVENLKTCPLYDVLYDHNPINLLELDYPMKNPHLMVMIVGSCYGLVCINVEGGNLIIWNPSTRKSIRLPDKPRFPKFEVKSYGFGYNKSSDDYKVVAITCSVEDRCDNIVMMYSSKTRNWKEIGCFPYWIWLNDSNVFVEGALHWIATRDCGSWIIVSLDLAKETYGEVLLPVDEEDGVDLWLGVLGDCLCVLCDYSGHSRLSCADVWVMKVYGVKDSWFKLVSIPYDLEYVYKYWGMDFSTPLCVSDDGKVLLQFGTRLIVLNSKDDSTSGIEKFNECYKTCTFVESLVEPTGIENLN